MAQSRIPRRIVQLGAALRKARMQAGLTQHQLGELAGVSRQLVSRVEAGSPRSEIAGVAQIADALGMRLVAVPSEQRAAPEKDRQAVQDLISRIRRGQAPESSAFDDHE
ncbi:helix-turn-helix domain-containing protein [Nocardia carnea]|uniref:helix-turn-helix domain-containing protein n=1 Tax=Nocardia carnea TaxID=37328 RepID=UPI002458CF49|nr:helix-turn-helix domain-containing protein [Nocardia carnea]